MAAPGLLAKDKAQSEHLQLANVLDQMPVGIGIFDGSGRLFHSNQHFEREAGGAIPSLQSMTGTDWHAIGPDGSALDEQHYPGVRALQGHVVTPGIDFVRKTVAGHQRRVGVSAVPLTAPGSNGVIGAVVVVENIEKRWHSMALAKAREAQFKRFAEHSSDALWIANVETGAVEYLSPAAQRIWEDHHAIETLADWAARVHPDDRPQALEARRMVAHGEVQRFVYRIVNGHGLVVRHVRETSFPIPAVEEQGNCIGGIIEDISPEVQIYLIQSPDNRGTDLIDELRQCAGRIKTFSCHKDLMNVADVLNPGCIVVDARGLAESAQPISDVLKARPTDLQVIFVGSQDTPADRVIAAMRAGAIDYILAPLPKGALARAVHAGCEALPSRFEAAGSDRDEIARRLSSLPRRESEVLSGLVSGGTNKSIARTLGISPRTVEVHRAHLMERLNVKTLTELLRLAHNAGIRTK